MKPSTVTMVRGTVRAPFNVLNYCVRGRGIEGAVGAQEPRPERLPLQPYFVHNFVTAPPRCTPQDGENVASAGTGELDLRRIHFHQELGDLQRSTLLQVLISIQSLIMVGDPFFNEPGFQSMMGTPQGKRASDGYNYTVREATVRYAMGDMLRRAGEGKTPFAAVIKKHFKVSYRAVYRAARWACL